MLELHHGRQWSNRFAVGNRLQTARWPETAPVVRSPCRPAAVFLDAPDVEQLTLVTRELKVYEFLVTCAPLRLPGGTGSAVDPLAVF